MLYEITKQFCSGSHYPFMCIRGRGGGVLSIPGYVLGQSHDFD